MNLFVQNLLINSVIWGSSCMLPGFTDRALHFHAAILPAENEKSTCGLATKRLTELVRLAILQSHDAITIPASSGLVSVRAFHERHTTASR
jgi:hypothetical protein